MFVGGKQALSVHYPVLAVRPPGSDGVEPGAFDGQIARQFPHAVTSSFIVDLAVVLSDPLTNPEASMPGRVVPYQRTSARLPRVICHALRCAHCSSRSM